MASVKWGFASWAAMFFISTAVSSSDILLPLPDGIFGTSISFLQLTDSTRNDNTFAPTGQARELMISIFQPVPAAKCNPVLVEYMPNTTASYVADEWSTQMRLPLSALPLGNLKLQACSLTGPPLLPYPLILFSPAFGTTRLLYSILAQRLASQGYTVVTLDHPYDVDIVTFLDPSTPPVFQSPYIDESNITSLNLAVAVRVQDASFVLSYLINSTILSAAPGTVSNATMFGHSLGGTASVATLFNDTRVLGGLNLDGEIVGIDLASNLTIKKPLMLFGASYHTQYNVALDPTWSMLLRSLTGWALEVNLARSRHYTFSDWPAVAEAVGLWEQGGKGWPNGVMAIVGTLQPERAKIAVATYVEAFVKFVFSGMESDLLRSEDDSFPEVSFQGP